jgi:hypothetical protein
LVEPHTISLPQDVYLKYFDDHLRPQFQAWIQEGILSYYQVFLQRYTGGRPWDALIVLTYKDDDSFGQRERVIAKVREQLEGNQVWRAAAGYQDKDVMERPAIIADEFPVR